MSVDPRVARWVAPLPEVVEDQGRTHASVRVWLLGLLGVALAVVTVVALGTGAMHIAPTQVVAILLDRLLGISLGWTYEARQADVLLSIRAPRVVMAIGVGAGLGAAGAALQGIFRNALADPGLIGVSSGAMLGAATCIVMGASIPWLSHTMAVPLAALTGGLVATFVVYRLATRHGRTSVATMLLAGIAVGAVAGAGVGYFTYASSDAQLRSLTMWSLGSLGGATWSNVGIAVWPALAAALGLCIYAGRLNAMLLGEAEAAHLGVPVQATRRGVVFLSCVAVGATVGFTGLIGFVGLVVPHIVRLIAGPDHRVVLPGAMLLGPILVLGADILARTLVAPAELPVGVVMAAIGGPFFLYLLLCRSASLGG